MGVNTRQFLLLAVSVLLSLAAAEVLLRVAGFPEPLKSGWQWADSPRRQSDDPANELGLRGRAISYADEDFVVLLVGDSQVEAATSAPGNMPERLLQRYLSARLNRRVRVFSVGAAGWGQDQQLLSVKRYFEKYRADLVLLWVTPENDFWENAFPDRSTTPTAGHLKPTYKLVDGKLQGPYLLPGGYYRNSALLHLIHGAVAGARGETVEQLVLDDWLKDMPAPHSLGEGAEACAGLTRVERAGDDDRIRFFRKIMAAQPDKGVIVQSSEDFLNSRSHISPITPASARDRYLVEITGQLLRELIRTAREHDARFMAFYPQVYSFGRAEARRLNDLLSGIALCIENRSLPGSAVPLYWNKYVDYLRDIVPRDNLLIFDVYDEAYLRVSRTDQHLNDRGNDRVMQALAERLGEVWRLPDEGLRVSPIPRLP